MDELVLQFSTTPDSLENWTSILIRHVAHSPFSHVDIILPDGNALGASDQGPNSPCIEGNPEGVAIRPGEYQEFAYRRRMILKTPLASKVIEIAKSQLGKPFDHSIIKEFFMDKFPGVRDWRSPDAWFCSELWIHALEAAGFWAPITCLPWPKNRVSPTDLLLIMLTDTRWVNKDTFWDVIPGLKLGPHEH